MKETQLFKYIQRVQDLAKKFKFFEMIYVSIEKNDSENILLNHTSTKKSSHSRTIIRETLPTPIKEKREVNDISVANVKN